MSETLSRAPLDSRFADDILASIQKEWAVFEDIAARPSIQEFVSFASRYSDVGDWGNIHFTPELNFLRFDKAHEVSSTEAVAETLEDMSKRLDFFLQGILRNYCEAKRIPVPTDDDTEQIGAILSKVMVGGVQKVHDYMDYPYSENEVERFSGIAKTQTYLPVTLFLLGARLNADSFYESLGDDTVEAMVSQAEINEAIDTALQESCLRIRANQKHVVPKADGANAGDRIYAASMNMLRTLYHQGSEKGFKSSLMTHFVTMFDRRIRETDYQVDLDNPAIRYAHQKEQFDLFAEHFNGIIGTDYTYPGPHALDRQLIDAYAAWDVFDADHAKHHTQLYKLMGKFFSTHGARHFVDAIADGTMKCSEIMDAMMHLRTRPLAHIELPTPELNKQWVNWEMLPRGLFMPGEGEHGVPPDDLTKPKEQPEIEVDWRRIKRLVEYAVQWGPDASFARTQFPNLPDEKQYYAVILPQQLPDGTIIEHAIADHPEQGNGLYVWRAERGYIREEGDRNHGLTWREVLSHERMVARQLGARCLYHTKNLAFNTLDYLTLPPEKLLQHRFAVGRGAARMTRLSRGREL